MNIIIEQIKSIFTDKCKTVLDGKTEFIELDLPVAPRLAIEYLEQIGVEVISDEFESNGWQYDYWVPCEYEGETYTLAGEGYEGKVKFYKGD